MRCLLFLIVSFNAHLVFCQNGQAYQPKNFRILVLAENGGHHIKFTQAAKSWLNQLAKENQFTIDYIENTDLIDSTYLSNYQLFLQLDYPPYGWPEKAVDAFEDFIDNEGGMDRLAPCNLAGRI